MSASTTIVRLEQERAQLNALLAEYEESLPPDLRHEGGPATDGTSSVAILALFDGSACGCVFVNRFGDESAIIQRLYVRPEVRGHGIARALMQRAIEDARVRGYSRLVLDTDKERLQAAYRLYLSLGFKPCAPFGAVSYANPTYMQLTLTTTKDDS